MNKQELIAIVAQENNMTKVQAGCVVDSIFNNIVKALANGDSFQVVGFGTFKVSQRQARQGRNPHTGETVQIAATSVPKFIPGAAFKAAVAK